MDDGEVIIRDEMVTNFIGKSIDAQRKSNEKIWEDG
jgi:hypothetical protein